MVQCVLCQELAVRPHSLQPCKHYLCGPCLHVTTPTKCPACRETVEKITLDFDLSRALEDRLRPQYQFQDQLRSSRLGMSATPPLIFYLDFEATDKTPDTCRIVQIGCIGLDTQGAEQTYKSYVKADKPMNAEASTITKITDDMLRSAPPCQEALSAFWTWLDQVRGARSVVLVAYNGLYFDFPLLFHEMWRWNMHPYTILQRHGVIRVADPLPWCRVNLPSHRLIKNERGPSFKLVDIYRALQGELPPSEEAHDALVDARMLMNICQDTYVVEKGFTCLTVDEHSRFELKQVVSQFQAKREGMDKCLTERAKDKANTVARRTLLDLFKRKAPSPPDASSSAPPPAKKAKVSPGPIPTTK